GLLGGCDRAGRVSRDLIAEKVEVHPGLGAAPLRAAEDLTVKPASRGQVPHEEGEVEGLCHGGSLDVSRRGGRRRSLLTIALYCPSYAPPPPPPPPVPHLVV